MLKKALGKSGILVDAVSSGAAALGLAKNGVYDLALIDINMKSLNGLELLEKIRRICPEIKVVMITAYPSAESQKRSMELGAADYLTKPIELTKLREIVNGLLFN